MEILSVIYLLSVTVTLNKIANMGKRANLAQSDESEPVRKSCYYC